MLRYPCLILDHDDTSVNSTRAVNYPQFREALAHFRPGMEITEEEYIRFALLSASPTSLAGADYLQLKVVTGEEQLWELLFAAEQLGATLAGCRPTVGDGETQSYQLTLAVDGADLAAFTYYLGMGWSRSTMNGFYRQIDLPLSLGQEHYL